MIKKVLFRMKTERPEALEINTIEELDIKTACSFVQDKMLDEKADTFEQRQKLLRDAMAGDIKAAMRLEEDIAEILRKNMKTVNGMTIKEAAFKIYSSNWGLGPLEELNRDPDVYEIRVNDYNSIYVERKGKSERVPVHFEDEEEVRKILTRMIMENDVSLNRTTPQILIVRREGSRLRAWTQPVTYTDSFILRKHGTFQATTENLIRSHTLNQKVWETLRLLVKGRSRLLLSGNPGAGKTTLMRRLVGELNPLLRVIVLGQILELHLKDYYPGRDIVELEAHPRVGATMKNLFEGILTASPDLIIVEEFRGAGEAIEAINACTRGMAGSMATAHFNSPFEAIEGTAMMLLGEGLSVPLNMAKLRVARAFDIIVQMFGDRVTGVKKITSISEVSVKEDQVIINDLVRWVPAGDNDFMKEGTWEFVGFPSEQLITSMTRFEVNRKDIERVFHQ